MDFRIEDEYIQLDKLLKVCDYADSGAIAHVLVDEGKVKLNGTLVLERRKKIRCGDIINVEGKSEEISVI